MGLQKETYSEYYRQDVYMNNLQQQIPKEIPDRQKFVEHVLEKMSNPRKFQERISTAGFKTLIRNELDHNGINLPFEYGVLDEKRNVVMKSGSFSATTKAKLFGGRLSPDNPGAMPNYLTLYFPGEKNYLIKSLGYMGTASVTLTLVILLTFGYTIYFILRQKKVSEIRNDFVNNMTHELKTPISTISLASQMLNDNSIPIKNIDHLSKVILDESKRLSYHVEKVLQAAIFAKGKIPLKIRRLDIHELINNVVKNFIIQVKNRNGQIIKNLDAEYSIVNVDEVHFANVLLNLLDNAIKYSKEKPNIVVSTRNKKKSIAIIVEDNGIGISKDQQKRIFEQFYRIPTGNVHNVKGFGLGLSYVKNIVEEHNGKISLESTLNEGTTFEITIPVAKINE
jgi:anti-sigma regulatory factor (Ser/Thr protein kinase)